MQAIAKATEPMLIPLNVTDPVFGLVTRHYSLHVPKSVSCATRPPLVLGFHGQGHKAIEWEGEHKLDALADGSKWVTVYPQALPETSDSAWNVGSNGDDSTCLQGTNRGTCQPTCNMIGACGRCCWSPCYDEGAFVVQLLNALKPSVCFDEARVFAVGESNGGMLVHYLAQTLPGTFLGVATAFALPLMGYATGPKYELIRSAHAARRTSILSLHDRNDTTIPWQGGNSSDGCTCRATAAQPPRDRRTTAA